MTTFVNSSEMYDNVDAFWTARLLRKFQLPPTQPGKVEVRTSKVTFCTEGGYAPSVQKVTAQQNVLMRAKSYICRGDKKDRFRVSRTFK